MSEILISSAAVAGCSEVFREVLDPDCNLAIWERKLARDFSTLLLDDVEDVRFQAPLSKLHESFEANLNQAGFASNVVREALVKDVLSLAERYCSLLVLNELEVRLEVVTTNSCRKWHADYVKARLISTYIGSGTQWLSQQDADRVREGIEPLRINSMSPGDAGIFKGKIATDTPAIHRSPPIAGTGEKRLLLVLNPVEED